MRRIGMGPLSADMDDEGEWHSDTPRFAKFLNVMTGIERGYISPADGDPLTVIFNRLVDRLQPLRAINTSRPPEYPVGTEF